MNTNLKAHGSAKLHATIASVLLLAGTPALANTPLAPIGAESIRNMTTSATWTEPSSVAGIRKAGNLSDGVAYSSWVGDPASETVSIQWELAGTRYLSELTVIPGCAGSNRTFAEFSRPADIVVSAGKREVRHTLKDSRKPQVVRFDPPLRARSVRLAVASTYAGAKSGVCFTELAFKEQVVLHRVNSATRERIDRQVSMLGKADSPQAVIALEAVGTAAIPALTYALTTGDFDTQRDALEVLRRIGSPAGADALVAYWNAKPSAKLVPLTLGALAATGDYTAMQLISGLIASEDFDVADAAAEAAGAFGDAMVPALAKLLKSDYDDVVERSLRTLSKIQSPRVVPLAAPYVTAKFSSWRTAAATALAASGSTDALPYLRTLSNDPHPSVRAAIASFADSFPANEGQAILARLAADDDAAVARRALHSLAQAKDSARYLAEYLQRGDAPLGNEAIELLAQSREPLAVKVLIDALARGESRFRQALRDGVESFGAMGVKALFTASLEDQRLKVDARALLAKSPKVALEVVSPLLLSNPTDADPALIETLGQTQSVAALATLDHVYGAGSISGKIAVVKAWGNYPADVIAKRVHNALKNGDILVRREAALSGSAAGVKSLSPVLNNALKDGSIAPEVVVTALARLKDTSAEAYMLDRFRDSDATMSMRLAVLQACKELQTPACIRTLYSAANDSNLTVRHEAMMLLESDDMLAQR